MRHHKYYKFFLEVHFPQPEVKGQVVRGNPRSAVGRFTFELDENKQEMFEFPKPKDRYSIVELVDGQLIIRLTKDNSNEEEW